MGRTILWLIEHYPQEKGLLHVTSYKQVNMLQSAFQALGATPPILYHTGQRRDERTRLFDQFRKRPGPLWLMSPSTREGEDFPHDQARVNVIVKIPYPDLADPIIAARREDGARGKAYYAAVTCGNLAQAYGRGVRADDDWGHSWILDKGIFNLLKYNRDFLPTYLKEAIVSA